MKLYIGLLRNTHNKNYMKLLVKSLKTPCMIANEWMIIKVGRWSGMMLLNFLDAFLRESTSESTKDFLPLSNRIGSLQSVDCSALFESFTESDSGNRFKKNLYFVQKLFSGLV